MAMETVFGESDKNDESQNILYATSNAWKMRIKYNKAVGRQGGPRRTGSKASKAVTTININKQGPRIRIRALSPGACTTTPSPPEFERGFHSYFLKSILFPSSRTTQKSLPLHQWNSRKARPERWFVRSPTRLIVRAITPDLEPPWAYFLWRW